MNERENLMALCKSLLGSNVPLDKNLFEMASLKEFRHSAILGYLLSRKEHGKYVHLKTLLALIMPPEIMSPESSIDVDDATVECERMVGTSGRQRPIDILCRFGTKALIIENKCRGAADQEKQIADYWAGVKALGYKDEDIYVLYLPPMNGASKPSEFSLGGLDFSSKLKGHLMVHSYRELILPWLKVDVLPQISYGHGALLDSLKSYIDLLEGAYGERPLSKDERAQDLERLQKAIGVSDSSEVWKTTTDLLEKIESVMAEDQKLNPEDRHDDEIRKLSELHTYLWRVRKLLREQNPLLDPDNLIYEVYWMLRNNPTPFGAKHLRYKLDSGRFFTVGRKGSIWDSQIETVKGIEHTIEIVCDSGALVDYLSGGTNKTVLRFGIGKLRTDSPLSEELHKEPTYKIEECREDWTKVTVCNNFLEDARRKTGGEMLWTIAEGIARQASNFSALIGPDTF